MTSDEQRQAIDRYVRELCSRRGCVGARPLTAEEADRILDDLRNLLITNEHKEETTP